MYFLDIKSPKISKTPPPSPAEFLREQAVSENQGMCYFTFLLSYYFCLSLNIFITLLSLPKALKQWNTFCILMKCVLKRYYHSGYDLILHQLITSCLHYKMKLRIFYIT